VSAPKKPPTAAPERGDEPAVDRLVRLPFAVDVALTMGPLRHGRYDPTIRFEGPVAWWALRTADGPATLRLAPAHKGWRVMAWGLGAQRAADRVPRLLGCEDDPAALILPHGPLRDRERGLPGLRFGRSDAVLASLVPAIIEQKVTGPEAQRAYRRLVLRYGETAPGPSGLHLPPAAPVLAGLPYYDLHPLGLEQRRAVTLIRAAREAERLEAAVGLPPEEALTLLQSVPGVGAWTAAETARSAFGDPDAVSVGDFHLPHLVCWALAGEPRGDDGRMLELLEPYRGQRARLVRILELSGIVPPRYGPRMRTRSIERL
jgi:3-methyladenine DNA glycosylase/8-oxoguanine DNA glycosylase